MNDFGDLAILSFLMVGVSLLCVLMNLSNLEPYFAKWKNIFFRLTVLCLVTTLPIALFATHWLNAITTLWLVIISGTLGVGIGIRLSEDYLERLKKTQKENGKDAEE